MTNGDFVNGIIFDENLKQIDRENGFIQKLTIKTCSHQQYINIQYYLKH